MLKRLIPLLVCVAAVCVNAASAYAATAPKARGASVSARPHRAPRKGCRRVQRRHGALGHRTVIVCRHTAKHHRAATQGRSVVTHQPVAKTASNPRSHRGGSGGTTGTPTRNPGRTTAGSRITWSSFASHVQTWAYDDCGNGGSGVDAGVVRSWVTYAESNCGPGGEAKALSDCHAGATQYCSVIQYLDTNWIYPNGSPTWSSFSHAAGEGWYQHTPGSQSTRIESAGYGGGYLINQTLGSVQSFFQNYVRSNYDSTDGLMMDDQSPSLSSQLYGSTCHCSASDEVSSSDALASAHEAMSAAMTHADGHPFLQIDNALPANPYLPQGFSMLNRASGVQGLVREGAPEYDGRLDPYYSTLLDQIAYVADETNGFVVPLSYGDSGASYQPQSRRVQEATMLLGYSPGHLVDWADLEQDKGASLAVWPEEGIYPTQPVQSMAAPGGSECLAGQGAVCSTGGHNDLQVAPGVYRREFSACYDHGVAFGPCAAIMNTTSSPVTVTGAWLTGSYRHQVTFDGGDVQSGGTVDLQSTGFTAGSSTIPAHDATTLAS